MFASNFVERQGLNFFSPFRELFGASTFLSLSELEYTLTVDNFNFWQSQNHKIWQSQLTVSRFVPKSVERSLMNLFKSTRKAFPNSKFLAWSNIVHENAILIPAATLV